MKEHGKVLIAIGWVLIVLSVIALVGIVQGPHHRDPSVEAFLKHPDSLSLASTIGFLIGSNTLSLLALGFGIYAVVRKNRKGKTLVITSTVALLVMSATQLGLPSSESATATSVATQTDIEAVAEEVSHALGGISRESITKELIEKLDDAPTQYTSLSDGFTVSFPSTPQQITIENVMGCTVKNYQSSSKDGPAVYNVFFNILDKKILSEEAQVAFMDGHLAGKLVALKSTNVIADKRIDFRGFNANRHKYAYVQQGVEVLCEGIVFILDGDSVYLSCLYLMGTNPRPSFDEFVQSFELLPLQARLSDGYWKDLSTGLLFRPPIDMEERKGKSLKSTIVTFANKAGHSLSIFNVTAQYPSFTLSDIMQEFSQATKDRDGFLVNTIHNPAASIDFVQLVKLVEHEKSIFMLQGYAPKQTFFRSERMFKESMNTVTFESP